MSPLPTTPDDQCNLNVTKYNEPDVNPHIINEDRETLLPHDSTDIDPEDAWMSYEDDFIDVVETSMGVFR